MSAFFNQLCCFGNPEVFGDLRDLGFVLKRDRNHITAELSEERLGHGNRHPCIRAGPYQNRDPC
jgi:hypothetical protein